MPFSQPEWARVLLVIVMVATPIAAATIAVERVVGRVLGDHRDQADREDRRDRGLDP